MEQTETKKAALERLDSEKRACEEAREKIFAAQDAELKQAQATDEYKALEQERVALEAKRTELSKREEAINLQAAEKFIECKHGQANSATCNKAYGSNILPDVLTSIGKHIRVSLLKGSQVEDLVNELVREEAKRLGIDAVRGEQREISFQVDKNYEQRSVLDKSIRVKYSAVIQANSDEFDSIEREIYLAKHPQVVKQTEERKKVESIAWNDGLVKKIYEAEFTEPKKEVRHGRV